ncbi:class I poly(R)-hydroxyalkanoic acid synthase [Lichenihabitans sp. Uapishka_5]|uniref:class I poly(R)-hydroxyalkanoic acid synthase n=1 Tax=Lichenihabitans sp. Uapishka_5 TaxID=3037302 RepID=UPI0029E80955|nr:class I poly(R)-hydroxyalkanoic acid synthase [Lichenihabitans sp. Uapishka_5]MDX7952527.1 class I poly(R)-hydroxyalkanoic acid synthase [Lichenihabitans sp. Uapishka_5]
MSSKRPRASKAAPAAASDPTPRPKRRPAPLPSDGPVLSPALDHGPAGPLLPPLPEAAPFHSVLERSTAPEAAQPRLRPSAASTLAPGPAATPSDTPASPPEAPSRQPDAKPTDRAPLPDLGAIAANTGKLIGLGAKVAEAYLRPRETGTMKPTLGGDLGDGFATMSRIAEGWLGNPLRMMEAQTRLTADLFGAWTDSLARFTGAVAEQPALPDRRSDKRFAAPEWRGSPMYDFLHQAYLVTTDWAKAMVDDAENLDAPTREKAAFYLRQLSSALSPSNFLATNPELIKDTFRENGDNLVRGMQMLAEDIAAGGGELKIRHTDASRFTLGVDMAATPGKVVFRNALMELLQYAPATPEVVRRPLLIVPPWINKFYVLDLNTEKSFIGWMVSQGLTVFVISWVNPDARHAAMDWDAYRREGIVAALDAIALATGEPEVATVGYCVGGTLLAATLAHMATQGDRRIASATLLTTQVDFEQAGDLKVFADEGQIRAVEREMEATGTLPGSKMANAFNMLRPDELIWSYAVNTYLKGKPPAAFDLLAWNADSTRMTAANHSYYLRNLYLENRLSAGEMMLGGERLDLGRITVPIYDLATREDHIAPARSVFAGARFFGGEVRYVLAGSGHIAGVVNPPAKAKYGFWTGGRPEGSYDDWLLAAIEHKGTWWLDWIDWLKAQAPDTVPARVPGAGDLPALGDAPGDYVRVPS